MHNMKSSIIAALLAIAHACAGTANAADDDPASAAARAGAMKWLSGAPTIHVAYTASTRHDPPADRIAARTDKYRGADLRRTEARAGSFDYSDGIARSDERAVSTTWDGGRPHWPTTSRHAVSRTSTRLEQLWWPVMGSSGPRAGQIDHPGEIPMVWQIDLVYGLRLPGQHDWFNPADLARAQLIRHDGDLYTFRVVSAEGSTTDLTFDASIGYALRTVDADFHGGDGMHGVVTNDDFRPVGGRFVPHHSVVSTNMDVEGQKRAVIATTFDISQFTSRPEAVPDEEYMMVWPKGTEIVDARAGINIVVDRDRRLPDEEIFQEAQRQDAGGPVENR